MSEYTHYYAVRSDNPQAVKSVLRENRIISIISRGDEYPGEAKWEDIPAERRWMVLSFHRAMHWTADGKEWLLFLAGRLGRILKFPEGR